MSACPICQAPNLRPYLSCEDHTASHEAFTLEECENCGFVITNPRPSDQEMPRYYQSDAYISHSNKSTSVLDRIYKLSRYFTLKWKLNIVKTHSLTDPQTILDFGCGTGAFLKECQKNGMKISGVEPSSAARDIAMRETKTSIWEDAPNSAQTYDAITLWHVLEHVPTLHQTLEKLKRLVAPNGTMFIAVPNLKSLDAQHYGAYWAGYDVPRHLWHFSQETMRKTLATHHLSLVSTIPMRLDAYYVSLLSAKYQKGTRDIINMTKALIRARRSNQQARSTGQYSSLIYIVRT